MAWLEGQSLPFPPGVQTHDVSIAIQAWNLLGGYDLGPALLTVVELLGVRDPEALIWQLAAIRDFQNRPES